MCKRYLLTAFIALVASFANAQMFSHYLGVANTTFNNRGMQRVAEVHYYYYVPTDGSKFELYLPILNYDKGGNDTEPCNYFRWYDYATDAKSAHLSAYGNCLKELNDSTGTPRGLFAWNLYANGKKVPSHTTIGVMYTPPADAADENWKGDVIACDVSRYNDFGGKGGTLYAEPTLSVRYIFHIYSAKRQARQIMEASSADIHGRYSDLTLEDNHRIVFGVKDANSQMTLRTNNPQKRYYFYPLRNTAKHIYADSDDKLIKSSDFNTSVICQDAGFQWRVYDQTKTKYTILGTRGGPQMWRGTSINTLRNNRNGWKTLDGKSTSVPDITFGSIVYFVVYAVNGNNMAPIANFEVQYQNTYPKTREEVIADGDNERMVTYLESHYQQAMKPISFDDDNTEMDLSAPTNRDDNMSRLPSKWDRRTYGFTYRELQKFTHLSTTKKKWWQPYTPVHGEYGLYKSANVKGISDYASGYTWWCSNTVYDRTYELSGGKYYGHFLYIDASDESRQIAAADFKANLCSGSRLIFTGAIADFTSSDGTQPQVMFRLYGVIRDDNDNITDQRLIVSFSSGDFKTNIKQRQLGKWFQVYSKLILPKNSGAENYSDFRIVMDNMCQSTAGADYLIDDLRLYISPAKVDVVQNKAVCPDDATSASVPKDITLRISAHYDNVQAFTGEDKESKLFYRICDLSGNAVKNIDYDGDGNVDEYGTAEVPARYDASKTLPVYAAGGRDDVKMFDTDSEHHTILLIADRHFDLPIGTKYYVSVAYPDEDKPDEPGTWGKPTNVCSTYSENFEIVKQDVVITDANGNVVTTIRVSCDADRTPDISISGRLETADISSGGSITLNSVKFDWFLSKPNKPNDFTSIASLQETLRRYRDAFPDATTLDTQFKNTDADGYALLKKYVDEGRLVIAASNDLGNHKFGKDMMGTYSIAAIPIATTVKEGKTTYDICPDPMYFSLRVVEDGPRLTLGFKDVTYPNDERTVRIGLPQVKAMIAKDKELVLPVMSLESTKQIKFENNSEVFISDTNDPTFDNTKQIVGRVKDERLGTGSSQLALVFEKSALTTLHEGYWYELNFSFVQDRIGNETVVSCPGESFIMFKVVPEYATWNSTPENSLNANWNNDLNWLRSTAAQLYRHDYIDYGYATYDGNESDTRLSRQQAYVPMKFTKVTIADQTGKVYPDLGNIVYRASNLIATKLTNAKGEAATANIEYDMAVKWTETTADHSDTGDGVFSCEKFQGNVCDAIYFKPHTELLDPCYLVYNRAYVEKELKAGSWYLASSPLRDTYAGDMYVPAADGRQTTEAFCPIIFENNVYSRTKRPVYQRQWDQQGEESVDGITFYRAYDFDGVEQRIDTISAQSLNVESLYWSHVYNNVDESYSDGRAFSIKAGDEYTVDGDETWLMRLPKADTKYSYFSYDGTETAATKSVDRSENYRLLVNPSPTETSYSPLTESLEYNTHGSNRYHVLGNPYPSTLSMRQFLKGNPSLENKVWTLEAGRLEAYVLSGDADDNSDDHQSDVLIEPMQAFFVKTKDGAEATEAYFTTAMTVDRWISGGTSSQSAAGQITLTASADGRSSCAKVVVDKDADIDNNSNAELLSVADLENVPQIYTVTSGKAMAVNTTSGIDWLPIGILAQTDVEADVTFGIMGHGAGSYWLFDSDNRSFTPVADGTMLKMRANVHGRYYLTTVSSLHRETNEGMACFSVGGNTIVISLPSVKIRDVYVYDLGGECVKSLHDVGQASCSIQASRGVYVVRVTVENGKTYVKKLAVN